MNKAELVEKIADKVGLPKGRTLDFLEAAMASIQEALLAGDKVTLVGFGTFELRERQSKEGRNPATGERITIPRKRVPYFNPGKPFKDKFAKALF